MFVGKLFLFLAFIFILALDWVALDDITTGSEPDLTEEYLMLFVSIPLLVFLGLLIRKKKES